MHAVSEPSLCSRADQVNSRRFALPLSRLCADVETNQPRKKTKKKTRAGVARESYHLKSASPVFFRVFISAPKRQQDPWSDGKHSFFFPHALGQSQTEFHHFRQEISLFP